MGKRSRKATPVNPIASMMSQRTRCPELLNKVYLPPDRMPNSHRAMQAIMMNLNMGTFYTHVRCKASQNAFPLRASLLAKPNE